MKYSLDDNKPIFQQIREQIEDLIIQGTILPEERIPSTNEFAKFYKINPATVAKGVNELVDEGIIYKKRGIGMFVSSEAKALLIRKRRENFYEKYIIPIQREAEKLNITPDELKKMIDKKGGS